MKTIYCSALLIALLSAAGCTSIQAGGDLADGRPALLKGDDEATLGYFRSAAQRDPNYLYGVPLQQCLELCGAGRLSYRSYSPSPANLGTGAFRRTVDFRHSTRRNRQALFGPDLSP